MDDSKSYAGIYPKLSGRGFYAQARDPNGIITTNMIPFSTIDLLQHYEAGVRNGEDREMTRIAFTQAKGQSPEEYRAAHSTQETSATCPALFKTEGLTVQKPEDLILMVS